MSNMLLITRTLNLNQFGCCQKYLKEEFWDAANLFLWMAFGINPLHESCSVQKSTKNETLESHLGKVLKTWNQKLNALITVINWIKGLFLTRSSKFN